MARGGGGTLQNDLIHCVALESCHPIARRPRNVERGVGTRLSIAGELTQSLWLRSRRTDGQPADPEILRRVTFRQKMVGIMSRDVLLLCRRARRITTGKSSLMFAMV